MVWTRLQRFSYRILAVGFIAILLILHVHFNQASTTSLNWPGAPEEFDSTAAEIKNSNNIIQLPCTTAPKIQVVEADLLRLEVSSSFTIHDAFEKLRKLRSDESLEATKLRTKGALISIPEGVYTFTDTLHLTEEDSGTSDAPVIVRGDTLFKSEITGAIAIPIKDCGTIKDRNTRNRIPTSSRSFVIQCTLPNLDHWPNLFSLGKIGFSYPVLATAAEVSMNGKIFRRARWPNPSPSGPNFAIVGTVIDAGTIVRKGEKDNRGARFFLEKKKHAISTWDTTDVWASGYFSTGWSDDTVPVASVNKQTGEITLGSSTHYGVKTGSRVFFFNALEALDEPGEYVIDRNSNTIILYPYSSDKLLSIQLSVLDKPLISTSNLSFVSFEFLNLTGTRGSAIQVVGGSHIKLMHLNIFNVGNTGIVFGQGAIKTPGDAVVGAIGAATTDYWYNHFEWDRHGGSHHLVYRCHIYDTGTGGIILGGGDRLNLIAGCNRVEESVIERFSRLATTYKPAVWMDGVGNACVRNTLRDADHTAIIVYGNAHLIEENIISNVMKHTVDVGAIYTGRDWTSQGTIIRYNYFLDSGVDHASAVYLDDLGSGMLIYSNVVENLPIGIKAGGGRSISATNNLFIRCKFGFDLDDRGTIPGRWNSSIGPLTTRLNTVPYQGKRWSSLFPSLSVIFQDQPQLPLHNFFLDNSFCWTGVNIIRQRDNFMQVVGTRDLDWQRCWQKQKLQVSKLLGSPLDSARDELFVIVN